MKYFLLFLLLLVACTQDFQDAANSQPSQEQLDEALCLQSEDRIDRCMDVVLLKQAVQESNPKICFDVSDYSSDDDIMRCVSIIAVKQQNRTACELLMFDHDRDYCLTDVFVSQGNISECQTLGSYERCYAEILATKEYPEQTCSSFEDRPFAQCYRQLQCGNSNDSTSCELLVREAERNTDLCQYEDHDVAIKNCFNRIAVLLSQPALCFKGIRDECFAQFAKATGNISYCELAGEKGTPCFRDFDADAITDYKKTRGINDIPECASSLGWDREECYYDQAQAQNESEYCEHVGGVMETCYEELALKLGDPLLCRGNRCFSTLAESLQRPTLCENITSVEQRYWCYAHLALKLDNPALCNNAAHDIKDMCFFEYVRSTGNYNLCHQVVSEMRKDLCFDLSPPENSDQ